jgi:hypothetical protein
MLAHQFLEAKRGWYRKNTRADTSAALTPGGAFASMGGLRMRPLAMFSRLFDNVVRRKRNAGGGCPGEFVNLCLCGNRLVDEQDIGGLAFYIDTRSVFLSARMRMRNDVSGLVMISVPTGIKQE